MRDCSGGAWAIERYVASSVPRRVWSKKEGLEGWENALARAEGLYGRGHGVAGLAADPEAPAQLRDAELASLMRTDEVLPLVHE
jgi:hypothetical protein